MRAIDAGARGIAFPELLRCLMSLSGLLYAKILAGLQRDERRRPGPPPASILATLISNAARSRSTRRVLRDQNPAVVRHRDRRTARLLWMPDHVPERRRTRSPGRSGMTRGMVAIPRQQSPGCSSTSFAVPNSSHSAGELGRVFVTLPLDGREPDPRTVPVRHQTAGLADVLGNLSGPPGYQLNVGLHHRHTGSAAGSK